MTASLPKPMRADAVRLKIQASFSPAGLASQIDPGELAAGPAASMRRLPGWIGRWGILSAPRRIVLWCEPRSRTTEMFPSQFVLDIPPGRYFVEVFDTAAASWISRESAEGGPLVAGLPYTGNPIFVWIRVCDDHP